MTDLEQPKVSVILTTHNDAARVGNVLACLEASTFRDHELVVVDDASRDGTERLVAGITKDWTAVRSIALESNVGVATARNVALRAARGTYVWFIDADDRFPSNALADLVGAADEARADVVFACAREVELTSGRSRLVDGLPEARTLGIADVCSAMAKSELRGFLWSKLIRRERIPQNPFPAVRSQSDFLGLITILRGSDRFVSIPSVVYDYLRAGESITTRTNPVESLSACGRALERLCNERGVELSRRDRATFLGLGVAVPALDTVLRTGLWNDDTRAALRRALGEVTGADAIGLARSRPSGAARLILAKSSLRLYGAVYHVSRYIARARRGRIAR